MTAFAGAEIGVITAVEVSGAPSDVIPSIDFTPAEGGLYCFPKRLKWCRKTTRCEAVYTASQAGDS